MVAFVVHEIEEEESNVQKLKKLLIDEENSVKMLRDNLEKQVSEEIFIFSIVCFRIIFCGFMLSHLIFPCNDFRTF